MVLIQCYICGWKVRKKSIPKKWHCPLCKSGSFRWEIYDEELSAIRSYNRRLKIQWRKEHEIPHPGRVYLFGGELKY